MNLLAMILLVSTADEGALRSALEKAKDVAARSEAVKKLAGAKEEKSIALLVKTLKDPEKEVRKAAAETLEGAEDLQGLAIKPLGAVMNDKMEDVEIRYAAAKALGKARFKADAIEALIGCITSISNKDRELFKFGADVTAILNKFAGENFGAGKTTGSLWEQWWAENKERIGKEDEKKRAAK